MAESEKNQKKKIIMECLRKIEDNIDVYNQEDLDELSEYLPNFLDDPNQKDQENIRNISKDLKKYLFAGWYIYNVIPKIEILTQPRS